MEFKIGKTCDGCDRILKNMKKISTAQTVEKIEDNIGSYKGGYKGAGAGATMTGKKDVAKFLEKTTNDVEKASKEIVKKMNASATTSVKRK